MTVSQFHHITGDALFLPSSTFSKALFPSLRLEKNLGFSLMKTHLALNSFSSFPRLLFASTKKLAWMNGSRNRKLWLLGCRNYQPGENETTPRKMDGWKLKKTHNWKGNIN